MNRTVNTQLFIIIQSRNICVPNNPTKNGNLRKCIQIYNGGTERRERKRERTEDKYKTIQVKKYKNKPSGRRLKSLMNGRNTRCLIIQ